MTQIRERYWSQIEVFFIGVMALFPEKLEGHEVNQWFYQPFFSGQSQEFIKLELEEYRKSGYLEYQEANPLYKITKIHKEKAASDLKKYLLKWQNDELLSLSTKRSDDAKNLKQVLLQAIADKLPRQSKPRIVASDIYDKISSDDQEMPFWELVLSLELLDNKATVIYMDYDRRTDGMYDENPQPLVDYELSDELIKHLKELPGSTLHPTKHTDANDEARHYQAKIIIQSRIIYAKVDSGETIRISRKQRADGKPSKFIEYMLSHPRTHISKHDIKYNVGSSDITELVRGCGFTKELKEIFFPGTTEQSACFFSDPTIDSKQMQALKSHDWEKVGKGGK